MKNMHYTLGLLLTVLVLGMTACQQAPSQSTVSGRVMDATMNNIMLVAAAGDTLNISTMDADPAQVPGVMVGDEVTVTYELQKPDGENEVKQAVKLEITAHSPYYYIAGTWVQPNPIDASAVQGFTLNPDGTAESVGMATLLFKGWDLADNGTLQLASESIGNKQTIMLVDTFNVVKLDADSLVLATPAGDLAWVLARQK